MLSIGLWRPVLVVILSSGENDINWGTCNELTLDMRSSCPPVVARYRRECLEPFCVSVMAPRQQAGGLS